MTPEHKPRQKSPCCAPGCDKSARAVGACKTHYHRMRRTGTYDRPPKKIYTHPSGYQAVTESGHLLAQSCGQIYVHRLVLFGAIGYGPHLCHWCSQHVNWNAIGAAQLQSDHVDGDRANNADVNLVASCPRCNTRRARGLLPIP